METYEIDAIKIEKQKAMRRYRIFRKIANIVRTLEIFIAIMIVSWSVSSISAYIPAAVEFSGAFFRRFSSLLFSPHFVFILGNAIVITLFAKSGDRTAPTSSTEDVASEVLSGEVQVQDRDSSLEEQDNFVAADAAVKQPEPVAVQPEAEDEERESETKTYERSRSSMEMMIVEKKRELRRSATEPRRKIGGRASPATTKRIYEVDELSSDEFRRTVEAFIEKHQRLRREESKSVVVLGTNRCNSL